MSSPQTPDAAAPTAPAAYRDEIARLLASRKASVEEQYLSRAQLIKQEDALPQEAKRGAFPQLVRGNPKQKYLALTIDDGPHPGYTEQLLKILAAEKVVATFFVVGHMVDANPQLVRMEVAAGHQVANHTYSHIRLPTLPKDKIEQDLTFGRLAILRAAPNAGPVDYFRPPGGEYNDAVIAYARKRKETCVLWTDDPGDYRRLKPDNLEHMLMRDANPGGIILVHTGVPETVQVLPSVLRRLKAQGYKFLTCAQLDRQVGADHRMINMSTV